MSEQSDLPERASGPVLPKAWIESVLALWPELTKNWEVFPVFAAVITGLVAFAAYMVKTENVWALVFVAAISLVATLIYELCKRKN